MGNCLSITRSKLKIKEPSLKDTDTILTPFKPRNPEPPNELPRPPSVIEVDDSSDQPDGTAVLTVKSVDICAQENALSHKTSEFHLLESKTVSALIIRRGFPVKLKLTLNRNYDSKHDAICLVFIVKDARNPSYSQGSMVFAPIIPDEENVVPAGVWQTKLLSIDEKELTIEFTPTTKAIIGEWVLDIDTKFKKEREEESISLRYSLKSPIYLLFNPWCKQDSVYLEDEEWKNEYVLNESGLIWRGTSNRLRPCAWNFGQFEENVLECCVYLLAHIAKLPVVTRADPIKVVRHISAVVNAPDDSGVLVGNWSGDYGNGKSPTYWSGSVAILQQFYKTKKSVEFGQCWVFSGVCTTVCRALGIPARSVTNFASAHDTHNSLTVDFIYDTNGEPVNELNIDSTWNFHVWNEVWMERPDLGPGYEGWQAIDATPQEESDGQYRCGPCSVVAIKRGEIDKGYDTPFIFAEVNADKLFWRYRGKNHPLKLIEQKTDAIGQFISTKAVGSYERMDITNDYKYKEHSKEEREVMLKALRQCENAFSRYYLNDHFEDIQFDFNLLDNIVIGSDFKVLLSVKNKGREKKSYTIKGKFRVATVLYTGEIKKLVKMEAFEKKIDEEMDELIALDVTFKEYEKLLVDQAAFNIAVMVGVEETGFDYFAQDDFRVRKPDIKINVEGDPVQGQEFKVVAQLKNPLPKEITKGRFIIEGPGLGQPLKIKVKNNILPNEHAEVTCKLCPKTHGEKTIMAKFWSKELDDVDGYEIIKVKPALESETNNKPALESETNNKPTENELTN